MRPNTGSAITEEAKLAVMVNINPLLTKIEDYLGEQRVESYLVGGCLRDILLGRDTADIDIAVAADAFQIARNITDTLSGSYIPLDEVNRIARIVLPQDDGQCLVDISTLRGSIKEDLTHRDFTIDAMAINLSRLVKDSSITHIIDPLGGQKDLRNKLIRVVSETSFRDDPIRMLRAVRLAAELDFSIDQDTGDLIRSQCHLLAVTAGERVHDELCHLLNVPETSHWLRVLDKLGLMVVVIPELNPSKGVEQPREHFWDVFDHSIETVAAVEYLLNRDESSYKDNEPLSSVPWSEELEQHFEQQVSGSLRRKNLMKIAALLHDVAKPQTKSMTEDGRAHFLGHANQGAEIAGQILARLRFSNREIKMTQKMIEFHLRVGQMSRPGEMPTRRAIYRYFRDAGDVAIDILFLSLADHLATRGPHLDLSGWQQHTKLVEYVLSQSQKEEEVITPSKLIDGHDMMSTFGLEPGPRIGELLETVREMQAAGEITTREEALMAVQRLLTAEVGNN